MKMHVKIVFFTTVLAVFCSPASNAGAEDTPADSPATRQKDNNQTIQPQGDNSQQQDGSAATDREQLDKRRYRFMLLTTILFMAGFFITVLLISIIRIGRYRRRQLGLGRKSPPTECIDAWSQHRLKDDQKYTDRE